MRYSIVYSSKTGNTELLSRALKSNLDDHELVYYGAPADCASSSDIIFVGFWTDKGSCDDTITSYLETLQNQKVFLFGTAGFGGSEDYFKQILERVESHLPSSNTVIGTYMCQGKMPVSVRDRYENTKNLPPEKIQELIQNFDQASVHPNQTDLDKFIQTVKKTW